MLMAYVEGYEEYLFDMQCLAVHQGFWAGYYQSKKPKPLGKVLKMLQKQHEKAKEKVLEKDRPRKPKPDVDVDEFLRREQLFKSKLKRM